MPHPYPSPECSSLSSIRDSLWPSSAHALHTPSSPLTPLSPSSQSFSGGRASYPHPPQGCRDGGRAGFPPLMPIPLKDVVYISASSPSLLSLPSHDPPLSPNPPTFALHSVHPRPSPPIPSPPSSPYTHLPSLSPPAVPASFPRSPSLQPPTPIPPPTHPTPLSLPSRPQASPPLTQLNTSQAPPIRHLHPLPTPFPACLPGSPSSHLPPPFPNLTPVHPPSRTSLPLGHQTPSPKLTPRAIPPPPPHSSLLPRHPCRPPSPTPSYPSSQPCPQPLPTPVPGTPPPPTSLHPTSAPQSPAPQERPLRDATRISASWRTMARGSGREKSSEPAHPPTTNCECLSRRRPPRSFLSPRPISSRPAHPLTPPRPRTPTICLAFILKMKILHTFHSSFGVAKTTLCHFMLKRNTKSGK
ncbi:hypothetical protein C7M84_015271 [Penaeus vannamei]|uniref:Uncharacterized protein n=1 Tax=Penaeus vannamei TaxID=6689 RepID=A0A423SR72_PENVA|nr:hypothetical protein C7M84_015271 [Penaeus vannamei]